MLRDTVELRKNALKVKEMKIYPDQASMTLIKMSFKNRKLTRMLLERCCLNIPILTYQMNKLKLGQVIIINKIKIQKYLVLLSKN